MKVSARNQFKGKIKSLTPATLYTQVVIELAGGQEIVSVITKQAADNLRLKVGGEAYAIIKASNVMVGVD